VTQPKCFCGCADLPAARHHCVTAQELQRIHRSIGRDSPGTPPPRLKALLNDGRNLTIVAFQCHGEHHARVQPYDLLKLPDSVFEFAAEVMGSGRAYEYLRRHYAGSDPRLDALLAEASA
jgi:hypothetical protein